MPDNRQNESWPRHLAAHKKVLSSDETFGSVALAAAFDLLGDELFDWHPETVLAEIRQETGAAVPKETADRLFAAVAVDSTDRFYADVGSFVSLCNALSGTSPNVGQIDLPGAVEMAWAVTEAGILSPPEEGRQWDPQIKELVRQTLVEEGFDSVPDALAGFGIDLALPVSSMTQDPISATSAMTHASLKRTEVDEAVKETMAAMAAQMAELMPHLHNRKKTEE